MCRADLDFTFVPQINLDLQCEIASKLEKQFLARIKDLKVTPPWEFVTTPTLLRVVYGNTHELVENPRMFKGHVMSHRFGMFFTINESIQHTLRYVRSVKYHLYPSFKFSEVRRS